jgi:hypothetical protein
VDRLAEEIEEELDDNVFSDNGDSLEQIVGYFMQMRNATLAVAESCTGGLLAERITSVSGSSRYFLGGAVVYSNQLKTAFADVSREVNRKARRGQRRSGGRAGRGHSQALRPQRWESGLQAWQARRVARRRSQWASSFSPWPVKKGPR